MSSEPREILRSTVTFHRVERISLRRGEGLEGGDAIVITVHEPSSTDSSSWYYLVPESGSKQVLRLASRVREVSVNVDERLASKLAATSDVLRASICKCLIEEGEAVLPPAGGTYPDAKIVIVIYDDNTAKLSIELGLPAEES